MIIEIDKIKVTARIRKQAVKLEELTADINKTGLINPITVMQTGEEYQLLAGLRRLRAVQALGWTEIEVNCVEPKDAEAALHIEHSENVQREPFTFSEKMDYARLIEEIEQAKALERMSLGGQGGVPQGVDGSPHLAKDRRRDIIGEKIGMSGRQYDRSKYIADNATQDVIDELDRGDRSISGAYDEMRAQPNNVATPTPTATPESDLDRAIRAERELDTMKYQQHNEIFHRDGIIENLKIRIAELEEALAEAEARIRELEEKYER